MAEGLYRRLLTPPRGSLRAIADVRRLTRRVLVYAGDQRLRTDDGIEVWPLGTFLDALASGRLWP